MNTPALLSYIRSLRTNPYPRPDYRVIRTSSDMNEYLVNNPDPVAVDTESTPDGEAYCLTMSSMPGTGRLIYVKDKGLLDEFDAYVTVYGLAKESEYVHQLFHNYLHDEVPYRELNLSIGPFTDTMVRAYNLCLGGGGGEDEDERGGRGPLSLKALAYRNLNMKMTSFRDTVFPHSVPFMHKWLSQAEALLYTPDRGPACECGCTRLEHADRGKAGKLKGSCIKCACLRYKLKKEVPDEDDAALRRLHTKTCSLIGDIEIGKEDLNPWKRYRDWTDWDHETLEGVIGKPPVPSIEHVPEPELLQYACRDADATLRLYLWMKDLKPWIFYDQ
jgi:hypothetical protein